MMEFLIEKNLIVLNTIWLFRENCELLVELRVEVEVLDEDFYPRSSLCLTLPAAAVRRLIVVIGVISSVWRLPSDSSSHPRLLVLDMGAIALLAARICGLNRSQATGVW